MCAQSKVPQHATVLTQTQSTCTVAHHGCAALSDPLRGSAKRLRCVAYTHNHAHTRVNFLMPLDFNRGCLTHAYAGADPVYYQRFSFLWMTLVKSSNHPELVLKRPIAIVN